MLGDALKIGLKSEEFWKMTPKEFRLTMEGYFWRRDQEGVMFSTFTAAIVNTQIKKGIKPDDLYRPILSQPGRKKMTKEEIEARKKRFEESVAFMGPEAIPVLTKEQMAERNKTKV